MIMHKGRSFACFIPAILLLFTISLGMTSCQKETINFNNPFVDNGTTNIVMVDSSTVEMSTVYLDSFPTSGSGTLFAGNFTDPEFGKISAESYLQLGLPAAVTFPNGSVFDSIEVILKLNKNYYGDTTIPYSVSVHQLTQVLPFPEGQTASYNIDSRAYNPTPLGSKQMIVSPNITDTISIRLPQAFGQDLFDKLNSNAIEIQNIEQFLNYFKGIAITGSASNNLILGFSDSAILRLHYLKPGVITQDATVDFKITNPSYSFNHVTVNRAGTPLAALGPGNPQIFSSQTGNVAYSQYITGAMLKIRFPYLLNLLNLPGFIKIINAQLVVKPVAKSYTSFYQLPPQLGLSATDQYNSPGPFLSIRNPYTGASAIQDGSLVIDNIYGTGTEYTYDITSYLQAQMAITQNNKNGLLLIPPSPSLTFNRVIAGDSKNSTNKTQLKVYYVF
ncbi:MAG TPA: DUF4270 family protein, partial [Hanamia sp.]|nr:DUF4270 family protein [Hanamia sp.]